MSLRFACFRFDPRHRQASLLHPLSGETLVLLPSQDKKSRQGDIKLHPASSFSPELASYVAWLARHHLLLRLVPFEADVCIEDGSDECGDENAADSGYGVQLDRLLLQIQMRQKNVWLDAGAGFVLLDGMLYSSFYLDIEELRD